MTTKYNTGAFVFSTSCGGLQPQDPEVLRARAREMGLDESLVPEYAGDRAAVSRALAATRPRAGQAGFVLGVITAPKLRSAVTYGIMRVAKNTGAMTLDHNHEATVQWTEGSPSMLGDHVVAQMCNSEYQRFVGKICSDDWGMAITKYLTANCYGTAMRDDGRIYWVPPQHLAAVEKLRTYLKSVGISLVLAEIEAENTVVVQEQAQKSLCDQLADLQAEADLFDGQQKPSTYASRLESYADLRRRASTYREALGIAVEDAQAVLTTLDSKVGQLLEVRQNTTIPKRPRA